MNIAQLIKDRNAGIVRLSAIRNWGRELSVVLRELDLAPEPEWVSEVSQEEAIEIIAAVLWKDLAYRSELMTYDKARSYGEAFSQAFFQPDCRVYSNGYWQRYHDSTPFSFNSMIEATFDGGVVVIHRDYAACLWVEDED